MAGEVAAIATYDRSVGCVVKFEVAIVAAGTTATIHVVAEDPATIAVVAALVAVGSVAARAPVAPAASIALARASREHPGGQDKANEKDRFHGKTRSILSCPFEKTNNDVEMATGNQIEATEVARACQHGAA